MNGNESALWIAVIGALGGVVGTLFVQAIAHRHKLRESLLALAGTPS